jgi:hypothetical protein
MASFLQVITSDLFLQFIKWFGTGLFALGAFYVSIKPDTSTKLWPFVLFLFGHLIWAASGVIMKDEAIVALNLMYVPLDLYAIFIRFKTIANGMNLKKI